MNEVVVTPWPRVTRSLAWAALVAAALVRLAIPFIGLDWRTEVLLCDGLTYLLPMFVVMLLVARLSVRTVGTVEHFLWGMLAPATALVLISESYWTWYALNVEPHGPPAGSPLFVIHLVAISLFLFVVIRMTRLGSNSLAYRVRFYVDVVGMGCLVFPLVYLGWTLPALVSVPGARNSAAVALAVYPLAAVILLAGTVTVFVGWKHHRWRPWERFTAASIGIYALGLAGMPVWYPAFKVSRDYGPTWISAVLGAGYLLLGIGAVYRLSAANEEGIVEPGLLPSQAVRWEGHIHPVLMILGVPVVGWIALTNPHPVVSRTLIGAAALLAMTVVARSLITDVIRTENLKQDAFDRLVWPLGRQELASELDSAVARASDARTPLSVLVVTLAVAPTFDTLFGRSSRDAAINLVVSAVAEAAPSSALSVFRLSADQLAVILEGLNVADASTIARRAWLRTHREAGAPEPGLELFSGVAGFPQHGETGLELLTSAQSACLLAAASDGEPVAAFDEVKTASEDELNEGMRRRIMRETVRTLAQAVDGRDPSTREHSSNVSELATLLARVLDLPEEQVHVIGLAALLHDVGKVGLRDEVLFKHSELSAEECREVEEHVVLGEMILAPANIDEVLPAVRHHHERWDGTGYPDGLAGHDIPLEARVLSICDRFDILSSGRANQPPLSIDETLALLEHGADSRYDPVILSAFVRLVRGLRAPGVSAVPTVSGGVGARSDAT